eukprot:1780749-Rhodomonas_salina.1
MSNRNTDAALGRRWQSAAGGLATCSRAPSTSTRRSIPFSNPPLGRCLRNTGPLYPMPNLDKQCL